MKDDRNMTVRGMNESDEGGGKKEDEEKEKREQLSRADIKRWRVDFQSFGFVRKDGRRAK